MGSLISLDIELDAIRSFLKKVISAADSEYSRLKTLSDVSEVQRFDDETNAYFYPEMWEKIAIRATLGELNALVEWELSGLAIKPFFEKKEAAHKKELFKPAYDLSMDMIIKFIENHYNIELNDFKDYRQINLIRNKVNSFKHRKGFKDPRRDDCGKIGEKHDINREEALKDIDSVRSFLKELWIKTRNLEG